MSVSKNRSLSYLLVFLIIIFFIAISFLSKKKADRFDFSRTKLLMGTLIEIRVKGENKRVLSEAVDSAFREIARLESVMSHYSEDSELTEIIRKAGKGWGKVSPELLEVVEDALEVSEVSQGAFDITVGVLGKVWSFGKGKEKVPEGYEVENLLPIVNYNEVLINKEKGEIMLGKKGMSISLGGIGKGYTVERAMGILKDYGVENAIINAGGDLKVMIKEGTEGWKVGVQDPREKDKMIAAFEVSNTSVATSGDYQKYFIRDGIRYHHLLDPETGFPARGSQGVTIITPDAGFADALATAAFVLGPERGMALVERLPDVEGLIVDNQGIIRVSEGLKGKIEILRE